MRRLEIVIRVFGSQTVVSRDVTDYFGEQGQVGRLGAVVDGGWGGSHTLETRHGAKANSLRLTFPNRPGPLPEALASG